MTPGAGAAVGCRVEFPAGNRLVLPMTYRTPVCPVSSKADKVVSSPSRRERKSLRAERRTSRQAPSPPCDGGHTGQDAPGLSLSHQEVALVNFLGLSPHLLLRGFHLRRAETSTADQTRMSGFTSARSRAVNGSPSGRQLWSQGRFGSECVFGSSIGLEKGSRADPRAKWWPAAACQRSE